MEKEIESITKKISDRNYLIVEAEKLNRDLKNKYSELISVISEGHNVARKCGFDISKAINIEFDESVIRSRVLLLKEINEEDAKLIKVDEDWSQKKYELLSPASKLEYLKSQIKGIHSEFTGEQKAFQDYLSALAEWKVRKGEIKGDSETPDSLTYMREKLDYLDKNLVTDINEKRDLRIKKSIDILSKKKEIQEFYEEIKEEISKKLSRSDVSGLSIASSFYCSNDFKNTILRNIKQNRIGSFYGSEDGSALLQEDLVAATNWNDEKSVENFLRRLVEYLEFDKRAGSKNEKTFIGEITKDRRELYSYVFGLSFIEPYYDLRQKGKSLEQLSPGEKGALLLVFYLVLDKEDIPLIIDQPEDNLDNNSVAKVLVPYIKEAKKLRQIIMVTHNPNLAVVADSEQVIKVSIDKENGNEFSFISGGIEHPRINEQIVEVLEGTIPAFSLRKDKYQIA